MFALRQRCLANTKYNLSTILLVGYSRGMKSGSLSVLNELQLGKSPQAVWQLSSTDGGSRHTLDRWLQ